MTYRYRCPYCNRAFKHAGSLAKHKTCGGDLKPGWCHASGTVAAVPNAEARRLDVVDRATWMHE